MEASELVKKVRKEFDLTQAQLGKLLGVSQPTVRSYEKGDVDKPNQKMIKNLEDILAGKIPIHAALRGVDKKLFQELIMGADLIDNEWLTIDMIPKLEGMINRVRNPRNDREAGGTMGIGEGSPTDRSGATKKHGKTLSKRSPLPPSNDKDRGG